MPVTATEPFANSTSMPLVAWLTKPRSILPEKIPGPLVVNATSTTPVSPAAIAPGSLALKFGDVPSTEVTSLSVRDDAALMFSMVKLRTSDALPRITPKSRTSGSAEASANARGTSIGGTTGSVNELRSVPLIVDDLLP